jgi:phospholipid N-methyltransferase
MAEDLKNDVLAGWSNKGNVDFLEQVSVEEFKHYVEIGGFSDDRDIDLIMPYIKGLNSIAELGAGYGRVIEALRKRGFDGKITAVERSNNFYAYMKDRFDDNTILLHKDIADITPARTFDAVLYMWCNISEWPKQQQASIVGLLASWVKPGGLLIIETMCPQQAPLNSAGYTSQTYIMNNENGADAYGYIPTYDELEHYIFLNQLSIVKKIDYTTKTNRDRAIYLLRCP